MLGGFILASWGTLGRSGDSGEQGLPIAPLNSTKTTWQSLANLTLPQVPLCRMVDPRLPAAPKPQVDQKGLQSGLLLGVRYTIGHWPGEFWFGCVVLIFEIRLPLRGLRSLGVLRELNGSRGPGIQGSPWVHSREAKGSPGAPTIIFVTIRSVV